MTAHSTGRSWRAWDTVRHSREQRLTAAASRPSQTAPAHAVRLISGIDASPVRGITEGLTKRRTQVSTPIDRAGCMEACLGARPTRVLEPGSGNALARMISETTPAIPAPSVADLRTVEGIRRWFAAAP